jgi:dienelactone hydrolase
MGFSIGGRGGFRFQYDVAVRGGSDMRILVFFMFAFLWTSICGASVVGTKVEYRQGDVVLEGYLAYDDTSKAVRPGVLVVHEWYGLNDYAMKRADQVAQLGYVAFALDMYGKGVRASTPQEAGALAGKYKADRPLMRARAGAGLDFLKKQALVDPKRVAALGYCFGGTTVLELARSGAEVLGVVSFHGGLDNPDPQPASNIRAKVLVLHGADDPLVPAKDIAALQEELRRAGADWQMVYYGDAVHSFTNPQSGSDAGKGVAYNERADHRSWMAMKTFFDEIFK